MEDDPLGIVLGVAVMVAIGLLFLFAAVVAIPATVVLGGGYLAWKWHNNSESTQTRRQMNELHELRQTIAKKISLTGTPDLDEIVEETLNRSAREVPEFVVPIVREAAEHVLSLGGPADLPPFNEAALSDSPALRSEYRQQLYALDEARPYGSSPTEAYVQYLTNSLNEILLYLPPDVELGDTTAPLSCQVIELLENPKLQVERLMAAAYTIEGNDTALYPLQQFFDRRLAQVAEKTVEELIKHPNRVPKPSADPRPAAEVAIAFLAGSPFLQLLLARTAYSLPAEARMEHMHVLAGSGHGKTQLLQSFIKADIEALEAHVDDQHIMPARSVVVIDSQGDLIRTIAARQTFSPDGGKLRDRIVIVDPTDVLHPPALNMFDVGQAEFVHMKPGDRAALYNGTVELYVYLFSELLDANLTARQATLFRYLAQLLLAIPEANLMTFLAVLEDDEELLTYASQLDATAQTFFSTQYVGDEFKGPKKEIAWRLWGLISNPALASMFNSPTSKIDLSAELQRGAVVLINTSKETLKSDGSKLFGRFWVALLAQAAIKRARIPAHKRVATHVYLDEAHEIVDAKAEEILNQARKYKIGLTISHQNLSQLRDNATRASVAASTATKLIGGASDKDARAYASDLRTTPEQILSAKKTDNVGSEFVTFVKNHMEHGITLSVPFGQLERMRKSSSEEQAELRENNRYLYSYQPDERMKVEPELAPEKPEPTNEGAADKSMAQATPKEEPYEFKLGEPEEW